MAGLAAASVFALGACGGGSAAAPSTTTTAPTTTEYVPPTTEYTPSTTVWEKPAACLQAADIMAQAAGSLQSGTLDTRGSLQAANQLDQLGKSAADPTLSAHVDAVVKAIDKLVVDQQAFIYSRTAQGATGNMQQQEQDAENLRVAADGLLNSPPCTP